MKRHKMVNLCPTTYELASRMPNFSKWVRAKLLDQQQQSEVKYEMWCPEHPEYRRYYDSVPVFNPYCTTCNLQMMGKWVKV